AVLLALPGACGDCQGAPRFVFAEPSELTGDSHPVGTVLRYKCRPGYVGASGKSPFVTCLPNSTWSADSDFCVGKSCGVPELPNGRFQTATDLRFGATISFTCNAGYRLVGKPTAECVLQNNAVFWDNIPYCEIIPCEPPPGIENGQHSSSVNADFTFGAAVTYRCNKGFSLIGNSTIHCTTVDKFNGVWSSPAPECKVVRCQNPEVENGRKLNNFATEYTYGDKVTFGCVRGHVLVGADTVTCDADNNWKPLLPTCDPRYCGSPPSIPFAELTEAVGSSSMAGTTLTYRCRPGFNTGSGKSLVVTCLINTTWSVVSTSCTRQQCVPLTIKNGSVDAENFLFGTTVTFSCNDGYKLKGSSSAKCVEAGDGVEWSVAPPSCERQLSSILCGEPPRIGNGTHNGTESLAFAHGSIVVYTCNKGFTLAGGSSIQCLAKDQNHGAWSTPTPECRGGANTIVVGILPLILVLLAMNF
ncbi:CR1 protein, partial [Alectura lathami]|nr:CR1 protein [Alectura lathami]